MKNLRLKETIAELQQEVDDMREGTEEPDALSASHGAGDDGLNGGPGVLRHHSRRGSTGSVGVLDGIAGSGSQGDDATALLQRVQELEAQLLTAAAAPAELQRLREVEDARRAEQEAVVEQLLRTGTMLEQELQATKAAEELKVRKVAAVRRPLH